MASLVAARPSARPWRRPSVAATATGQHGAHPNRVVHVITTDATDLFGVHRMHPCDGTPSSFVMAFKERDTAEAMALGLEAYHRLHGTFPSRDLGELHEQLRDCAAAFDLADPSRAVRVDTTDLAALGARLRGTRIVVTLVGRAGEDDWDGCGVREGTFQWQDVLVDETAAPGVRVPALNRLFYDVKAYDPPAGRTSHRASAAASAGPTLLPRPRWPPRRRGGLPITSALLCSAVSTVLVKACVAAEFVARLICKA